MLLFRCPRCGKGRLFHNFLDFNEACSVCGLSFKGREQGDGPAFFAILIVGTFAAVGAVVVAVKYDLPMWVHAAIWIPFIILGTLASLRFLKAALMHMQYQVKGEDFK